MEITRHPADEYLELRIVGRLDAYWADHLTRALDEEVRGGAHNLRLNLASVDFLSSAGIRVLLQFFKQLRAIRGQLLVVEPSTPVREVLELSGLKAMLVADAAIAPAVTGAKPATPRGRVVEKPFGRFELFEQAGNSTLSLQVLGDPSRLPACDFSEDNCQDIRCPEPGLALGLGALGKRFEDAVDRFGEFLAVAGAATYLPTDGANVPDYLLAAGGAGPEIKVGYGLACEGRLGLLARFHAEGDVGSLALSELAATCLELANADAIGVTIVAESAGLVGASLLRSPFRMKGENADLFDHPQVRENLAFTMEGAHARSLTLVVGVAARAATGALAPMVRPVGPAADVVGHFHAAAFAYRPIPQGSIELKPIVESLFQSQTPLGVLHLLADDRPIVGGGESRFVRGAAWFSPIASMAVCLPRSESNAA